MAVITVTKCKKSDFGIITLKNCKKYQRKSNNLKPRHEVSRKLSQDVSRKPSRNVSSANYNDNQ